MPIIARSESHSSRVGIMTFVLVAIMLIDESESVIDENLVAIIAYPTEDVRTQIVEKETIACMGCARLPMARIDVSAMAR